jgi:hypothetical protein
MRYVFALLLGAAAGYAYGFRDAQSHDKSVLVRVVGRAIDRIDAATRDKMGGDADARLEKLERR